MSTRVARWAMLLEEFDYVIEHRSNTRMGHVDALSRYTVMTFEVDSSILQVLKAQKQDTEIKAILEILKDRPYEDYLLKNNVLFKLINNQELLVVPRSMQTEIIRKCHEQGHFAQRKNRRNSEERILYPEAERKD